MNTDVETVTAAPARRKRFGADAVRARVRTVPAAAWAIVLLAFLHSAAWAVLTPAFQGPDEFVHYGYVQQVAETGKPPTQSASFPSSSKELLTTLLDTPWSTTGKPSWSPRASEELSTVLGRLDNTKGNRENPLNAGYQADNPPFYAYTMAVPYLVTRALGGDVLDRLVVMRLVSALYGALTIGLVLLLLRELFPRRRAAWWAGGLAVALQPAVGWLFGSLNNDLPVILAGTGVLWLLVRGFRRGLSPSLVVGLGGFVAIAMLSKVSGYILLVVAAYGLAILLLRSRVQWRRLAVPVVLAVVVALIPWLLVRELRDVTAQTVTSGIQGIGPTTGAERNPRDFVSYLWQFYLPKLPFMDEQFATYPTYPLWQTYIQPFAGRFGWFEYGFSPGASGLMAGTLVVLLAAAGVAIARTRDVLRRYWQLGLLLVGSFVGYAVAVNVKGWQFRVDTNQNFEQVRYLFPMIGLYGVLVATALLAFPRRWHRGLLIGIAAAGALHVIASWGLTLTRYYM